MFLLHYLQPWSTQSCEIRNLHCGHVELNGHMVSHRIKELREMRGMSQERLGALIGRSKSVISRLEDGTTQLDLKITSKIADALGVSLAEVLNIETSGGPRLAPDGLAEDLKPYTALADDSLMSVNRGPNKSLYQVQTNAVELSGIRRGDIVEMDDSAEACRRVVPLQVVRVLYHPPNSPNRAFELLRLYLPPRKLITNSGSADAPTLDMQLDDAHIVAVVSAIHPRFS